MEEGNEPEGMECLSCLSTQLGQVNPMTKAKHKDGQWKNSFLCVFNLLEF